MARPSLPHTRQGAATVMSRPACSSAPAKCHVGAIQNNGSWPDWDGTGQGSRPSKAEPEPGNARQGGVRCVGDDTKSLHVCKCTSILALAWVRRVHGVHPPVHPPSLWTPASNHRPADSPLAPRRFDGLVEGLQNGRFWTSIQISAAWLPLLGANT